MTPLDVLRDENQACRKCGLGTEDEPVRSVGPPAAVYVIGAGPSGDEGLLGRPFEERAGLVLKKAMRLGGLKHEDCALGYLTRCLGGCRATCKGWLWEELKLLRPKVLVALGAEVGATLLRQGSVKLADVAGQFFDLPYLPGTALAVWYSEQTLLQRGRDFERRTADFFKTVKEKACC